MPSNGKQPLPPAWRWVRLDEICSFYSGGTPSKANASYWAGDIPWVSPKDMKFAEIDSAEDYISPEAVSKSATRVVQPGTVLCVTRSGILKRTIPLGIVGRPVAFNQDIRAIVPKDAVDPWFLFYALRRSESAILRDGVKTGATVQSIRSGYLEQLRIPLPPLPEQRRIAAVLAERIDAVEQARAAARAQLEAAHVVADAYVSQMLDGMQDKWPLRSLGELCLNAGQYGVSSKATVAAVGVPMLRMGNISNGKIVWDDLKYAQLTPKEVEKYRLAEGDIVFNRTNSAELVGKTAVFRGEREAIFASYLIRFRARDTDALPDYITAIINSKYGRTFVRSKMTRAIGQVNISASVMRQMRIPTPPIELQQQLILDLSRRVGVAEKLLSRIESQLKEIESLPAALLRQAFAGEL